MTSKTKEQQILDIINNELRSPFANLKKEIQNHKPANEGLNNYDYTYMWNLLLNNISEVQKNNITEQIRINSTFPDISFEQAIKIFKSIIKKIYK